MALVCHHRIMVLKMFAMLIMARGDRNVGRKSVSSSWQDSAKALASLLLVSSSSDADVRPAWDLGFQIGTPSAAFVAPSAVHQRKQASSIRTSSLSMKRGRGSGGKKAGFKASSDAIQLTGQIVEALPGSKFAVQIEGTEQIVTSYLTGKMTSKKIKILAGDTVDIEMSPYDLSVARITYRHREEKRGAPEPELDLSYQDDDEDEVDEYEDDEEELKRLEEEMDMK